MILTRENYFSEEAESLYLGSTSFKNWDIWHGGCEAREIARMDGVWKEPSNDALLLGSYVHAWNSDDLEQFKQEHPELFKKDGNLYAKYALGDEMIKCFTHDALMMKMREGDKEQIFTGKIAGVDFKIQVDILNLDSGYFADIKTTQNLYKKYWNVDLNKWVSFIKEYDYLLQLAIYAEIIRQNYGARNWLDSYLLVVDKQETPNHEILYMGTDFIQEKLDEITVKLPRIMDVKNRKIEPIRCGKCDYCKSTKKIKKAVHYLDFIEEIEG